MILTFKNNEFEMDNIRSREIHNPAFYFALYEESYFYLKV